MLISNARISKNNVLKIPHPNLLLSSIKVRMLFYGFFNCRDDDIRDLKIRDNCFGFIHRTNILMFNKLERYVVHLDGLKDEDNVVNQMTIPLDIVQSIISCVFFAKYPMMPIYLYSYIYSPDNPFYWLIPGIIQVR